jgi:hypothetical protein
MRQTVFSSTFSTRARRDCKRERLLAAPRLPLKDRREKASPPRSARKHTMLSLFRKHPKNDHQNLTSFRYRVQIPWRAEDIDVFAARTYSSRHKRRTLCVRFCCELDPSSAFFDVGISIPSERPSFLHQNPPVENIFVTMNPDDVSPS